MLRRCIPHLRGKYSSMMDLGGTPLAKTNTKLDFSRNSKVRAVALDFDLLTRSIEESRKLVEKNSKDEHIDIVEKNTDTHVSKEKGLDIDDSSSSLVQNIASMLNVELNFSKKINVNDEDPVDDLSRIINSPSKNDVSEAKATIRKRISNPEPSIIEPYRPKDRTETTQKAPPDMGDIRSKYASKIQKKLNADQYNTHAGIATLDRYKEESNRSSTTGDAESHFHARNIAINSSTIPANGSTYTKGSKWLSTTGTGKLLSFLSSRSMKIILLPVPKYNILSKANNANEDTGESDRMEDLSKQLPNIHFYELIKHGTNAETIFQSMAASLQQEQKENDDNSNFSSLSNPSSTILPKQCLIVSDRDDYLKMAKEGGMFTCRVRPESSKGRRGNITAAYNVNDMSNVEDIVNEINGISFNSVFSAR